MEAWGTPGVWNVSESLEHREGRGLRQPAAPRGQPGAAQVEPCMRSGSKMKNLPLLHNEIYFKNIEL